MINRLGKQIKVVMSDGAEFEGKIIEETSSKLTLRTIKDSNLRTIKDSNIRIYKANIRKEEIIVPELPKEETKKEVEENATIRKTKI